MFLDGTWKYTDIFMPKGQNDFALNQVVFKLPVLSNHMVLKRLINLKQTLQCGHH